MFNQENNITENKQTNLQMLGLLENAEEQINKQEDIIHYMGEKDPDCLERIQEWANRSRFYTWDRDYQKSNEEGSVENKRYQNHEDSGLETRSPTHRSRSKSNLNSDNRICHRSVESNIRDRVIDKPKSREHKKQASLEHSRNQQSKGSLERHRHQQNTQPANKSVSPIRISQSYAKAGKNVKDRVNIRKVMHENKSHVSLASQEQ